MDGARRTCTIVLAVTALVAAMLAAFGTATAAALTSAQANRIALRALKPQQRKGRVVVFTLRRKLGPNEIVFQANPLAKPASFRRPGRSRWFFWMDLNFGAQFAHASRAITIDDRTGGVLAANNWSWQPLINGRVPPYL